MERMREFDQRFPTRRMAGSDRYGGLWPTLLDPGGRLVCY